MKNLIIMLLIISGFSALAQENQDIKIPTILFKVSPQHFTVNTLKVGAEVFNAKKNKSFSFFLSGRMDSNRESYNYYSNSDYQGIGGEVQVRKYISPFKQSSGRRNRNYLQGIYVGGYLQGGSFQNSGERTMSSYYDPNTGRYINNTMTVDEQIASYGAGFSIGVHRTLWGVLFVDAYIGGGIQGSAIDRNVFTSMPGGSYYDFYGYNSITSPGYQGILPKFGIQLGFAL